MRILVIGGMHGNEPLGIDVVKLFENSPVENIDVMLANNIAIEKNVRFIKQDLNRSFPGDLGSNEYEIKRAAQILEKCKNYDVILDFHNTHCPNNDCSFIGETAEDNLYDVSEFLELEKVIVADYDCLNKFAPNCISIEISLSSKQLAAETWYEKIVKLSRTKVLPTASSIETYKFVHRISTEERDEFNLEAMNLKAFEKIESDLADKLNVKSPAFPIFIADKYTPYNYGGLLNKSTISR